MHTVADLLELAQLDQALSYVTEVGVPARGSPTRQGLQVSTDPAGASG